MSEMALTAEHLIVIGRGRLIADVPVDELIARASRDVVRVRSPDGRRLRELLAGPDRAVSMLDAELLEVKGASAQQIGDLAREHGLAVYEMTPRRASLEEAFMALTHDAVEFDAREVAA
jgi:ABC-2 type transport system ATP-binding protein